MPNSGPCSSSGSQNVPEIEIKLESSDEEEERFERNVLRPPSISGNVSDLAVKRLNLGSVSDCHLNKRYSGENLHAREINETPNHSPLIIKPTRKRKSTSGVWQFFSRDANNICRAICSICQLSVSRGKIGRNFGTTALKRHLESKHPVEWAQRESTRAQRTEGEDEEGDEEEKKQEPYEKVDSEHNSSYSAQAASVLSLHVSDSPRTAEIIDSSDDGEEEYKERDGRMPVEFGEEIEQKRMRILGQEDSRVSKPCSSFTTDARDLSPSLAMMSGVNTGSFPINYPDYASFPPVIKKRKPTSAVWQFFYIDGTNICRAICTLCQVSVSRGKQGGHFGTSALMRHLEGKHPMEWARGKISKSKDISIVDLDDDEEDETDEQLGPMYPQPQIPCGYFTSPSQFSDYSNEMSSVLTSPGLEKPLQNKSGSEEPNRDKSRDNAPFAPLHLLKGRPAVSLSCELNTIGKYVPNHPKAQSWNRNVVELMCEMALPYSFINSKAFRKFMARADPKYCMPSKSFFSSKAVPLLYESVCKEIVSELKKSECPHVHLTTHVWSSSLSMDYLALAAHWAMLNPDNPRSNPRKYAVLCIKSFSKDYIDGSIQQELIRQINLWLSPNALSPGFFISSGNVNLVRSIKSANFTYIPCFAQSLNVFVMDFLQNNHYITSMLETVRKVCTHFTHSARARRILNELQFQNNLPRHSLKVETSSQWTSTFYMLQRLLEQQRAVQEYLGMHKLEASEMHLTSGHWNLMASLVDLLQPFEMVIKEVNTSGSCLSQVLPEVRYLHMFLKQIKGHFESKGDVNGVALGDSFALKLNADFGVNEMFQREEYVLASLLDPRFKGRIEAILPPGSDIDHWKQTLINKVKEIMSSSLYASQFGKRPVSQLKDLDSGSDQPYKAEDDWVDSASQRRCAMPIIQKEKSLIEHLESVGLMASKSTGASLMTESHSACVMVENYLQDNKTIGAKEDPLVYWEKKKWVWPALTKLAVMYLTCPPSSFLAERVCTSLHTFVDIRKLPDVMEGMEHIVFLNANLENFPNYAPPPMIFFSDNDTDQTGRADS